MWAWGVAIVSLLGLGFLIPHNLPAAPVDPLQAYVRIEDHNGHGTGTFISPTQVLTAKHVTEHLSDDLRLRGPEGDIYHIIGVYDGPADISIIEVDRPLRGTPLPVSCDPPKRGDKLSYYGNPIDIEFVGPVEISYMGGKPFVPQDEPEMVEMTDSTLLVNGEAEPGVSGAGVIDSQGRVVGVYNFAWNSTTFGGMVSLSFAPVCKWVMEELQQGAHV
jgi:hypothetical protein